MNTECSFYAQSFFAFHGLTLGLYHCKADRVELPALIASSVFAAKPLQVAGKKKSLPMLHQKKWLKHKFPNWHLYFQCYMSLHLLTCVYHQKANGPSYHFRTIMTFLPVEFLAKVQEHHDGFI